MQHAAGLVEGDDGVIGQFLLALVDGRQKGLVNARIRWHRPRRPPRPRHGPRAPRRFASRSIDSSYGVFTARVKSSASSSFSGFWPPGPRRSFRRPGSPISATRDRSCGSAARTASRLRPGPYFEMSGPVACRKGLRLVPEIGRRANQQSGSGPGFHIEETVRCRAAADPRWNTRPGAGTDSSDHHEMPVKAGPNTPGPHRGRRLRGPR